MARAGVFLEVIGVDKSEPALNKAGSNLDKVAGRAEKTQGRMSKAFGKISGPFRSLLPAAGIASVAAFGKSSVAAFSEAELAAVGMSSAIEKNKSLAGATVGEYQALASAIQSKTRADDESILSGAAVLGNFNLTNERLKATLPLVVDYARKTGKDVPTAAKSIGKAMLGNTRALKDLGISYKSTGDKQKDMANITQLLRDKVGGFAESEAKTTAGRIDIMKNKFDDLLEIVGGKMVGAFDFLSRNLGTLTPIIATGIAMWGTYKLVTLAVAATNALLGTSFTVAVGPIALVVGAIVGLGLVAFKFRKQIGGALQSVARFFVGVFGRIRGIVVGIKNFFVGAFGSISNFFVTWGRRWFAIASAPYKWIWNAAKWLIGKIRVGFTNMKNGIVGIFTGIKDRVISIWGGISEGLRGGINLIIGFFNGMISGVENGIKALLRAYNKLPLAPNISVNWSLPQIPTLDTGGTVLKTGLAMVHEGEEWSGVGASRRWPAGGGGDTVIVNVRGSVVTERELSDIIHEALLRKKRTAGSLGLA